MNLMSYRGYLGSVEFDEWERIFYGRLEFIRALVSYEAKDAEGLVRAFHEAVDDYLMQCEEQGAAPERPLKGSFNVRTRPELHRRAVIAAARCGMSLNAFVTRALEAAVARGLEERPKEVRKPAAVSGA
jgi:predicted HicB family RNase H-like nuclease